MNIVSYNNLNSYKNFTYIKISPVGMHEILYPMSYSFSFSLLNINSLLTYIFNHAYNIAVIYVPYYATILWHSIYQTLVFIKPYLVTSLPYIDPIVVLALNISLAGVTGPFGVLIANLLSSILIPLIHFLVKSMPNSVKQIYFY